MSSRRPSCLLETSFPESPALRVPGPWAAGEERGQGEGSGTQGGSLSWGRVSTEGACPPPSLVAGTPAASPCFLAGTDVHPRCADPGAGEQVLRGRRGGARFSGARSAARGAGGSRGDRGPHAAPGAGDSSLPPLRSPRAAASAPASFPAAPGSGGRGSPRPLAVGRAPCSSPRASPGLFPAPASRGGSCRPVFRGPT